MNPSVTTVRYINSLWHTVYVGDTDGGMRTERNIQCVVQTSTWFRASPKPKNPFPLPERSLNAMDTWDILLPAFWGGLRLKVTKKPNVVQIKGPNSARCRFGQRSYREIKSDWRVLPSKKAPNYFFPLISFLTKQVSRLPNLFKFWYCVTCVNLSYFNNAVSLGNISLVVGPKPINCLNRWD